MRPRVGWFAAFLLGLAALPGCRWAPAAAPPLPTVVWQSPKDARRILIQRQAAVQNVQAECRVRFTDATQNQDTQTLSGALVLDGDHRVRLRTWKLNQTIFDLTVNDDGVWVAAIDELKEESPGTLANLGRFADQLGAMLRGPDYRAASFTGKAPFDADAPNQRALRLTWDYGYGLLDRRTLTLDTFILQRDDANTRIDYTYARYDGQIWFRTLKLRGDFGELDIAFRNVELNGGLNPRAFKPPRRAVRIETDTAVLNKTAPLDGADAS